MIYFTKILPYQGDIKEHDNFYYVDPDPQEDDWSGRCTVVYIQDDYYMIEIFNDQDETFTTTGVDRSTLHRNYVCVDNMLSMQQAMWDNPDSTTDEMPYKIIGEVSDDAIQPGDEFLIPDGYIVDEDLRYDNIGKCTSVNEEHQVIHYEAPCTLGGVVHSGVYIKDKPLKIIRL